jgi:integrase
VCPCIKLYKQLEITYKDTKYISDHQLFRQLSYPELTFSNGILSYRRHKTGQQLFVKWEQCMQDIYHKWENQMELYLLPILKSSIGNERCLYKHTLYAVNKSLKEVAKLVKVTIPLTMYVARHSWASTARSKRIPLSVISEGMGHDSETTTQIYLASLDSNIIDDANSIILKGL